jgi:hypothetical protein
VPVNVTFTLPGPSPFRADVGDADNHSPARLN